MCSNSSVSETAAARLVVSDRGESLSPKYAPEIMAPAVTSIDMPAAAAMPTSATPTVPAVVQELPIETATTAQIITVAT